jgi:UPF0271 protein
MENDSIDLNLDAGESLEALNDGREESLYRLVSSVSIACGGHTGDETSMNLAVKLAKKHHLNIGAHPSFPDRKNFGRVAMQLEPSDLIKSLTGQVSQLQRVCDQHQVQIMYIKPHGALYNLVARDLELTTSLIEVLHSLRIPQKVMALAGSKCVTWFQDAGITVLSEGFVDRRYESDGTLRSRVHPDAILHDLDEIADQAVQLVRRRLDTLCIHGDTPDALRIAQKVRQSLEFAGVKIKSPS